MRQEMWDAILLDKLVAAYSQALGQADFLLHIELKGRPRTYNHYFSDNLQRARKERDEKGVELSEKIAKLPTYEDQGYNSVTTVSLAQVKSLVEKSGVVNKSNGEQIKEDIHDAVKSYYKVSRKRFVDVVCQQVVDHFLLDGSDSPLKILNPSLVSGMSDSQLDRVAGEDTMARAERRRLEQEIKGLEEAVKVLRS